MTTGLARLIESQMIAVANEQAKIEEERSRLEKRERFYSGKLEALRLVKDEMTRQEIEADRRHEND